MANLGHIEAAARRKLGTSDAWEAFSYEAIAGDYIVIGDVPVRHISRGKSKGRPQWKGPGTKVIVVGAEVKEEIARYIRETGNCPDCLGTKEQFESWSVSEGLKKSPCSACTGSGKHADEILITKD
jgi:hypothetical protein